MWRGLLIALWLTGGAASAQADSQAWNGRWSGTISTGVAVSITISRGKVSEYRFGRRAANIAYGSVSDDRVSFSPGSAAVITMTPAGPTQANYSFAHPQMGPATGLLSKSEAHSASAPVRIAARAPKTWHGTWGRESGWMLTVSQSRMAYRYRGESLAISNISADEAQLAFDIAPAGRMVLTMRPDQKADYAFTAGGSTTRGTAWRR
ncbi:hypothetical protein [Bosea sp. LjRoot237]|uniref:hypothetical protein n=1 Tax=Bosea sp. LjRoot237 TaxID=3342292 RepID=UPI003ECDE821